MMTAPGLIGDALGAARDLGDLQRAQAAKQRQHRQVSGKEIQWRPFELFAQLNARPLVAKQSTRAGDMPRLD